MLKRDPALPSIDFLFLAREYGAAWDLNRREDPMRTKDPSYQFRAVGPQIGLVFPVRVTVHLPVKGRLGKACADANSRLLENHETDIDFSTSSFQIPHITLHTGLVWSQDDLEKAMLAVSAAASDCSPFDYPVSTPYLKEPYRKWLFVDVNELSPIETVRNRVRAYVGDSLDPLNREEPDELPHITLAHFVDPFPEEEAEIEALSANFPTSGTAQTLGISFGGTWGCCLGTIREYDL